MTDEELGVGYFDSLLYKGMLGGLPSPTTTLQQPPQQASQPPQQQQAQPQDGAPQQGRDRAPPQQSSQAPTPQSQQQQQQQQRPAHASPPETPQTPPISPHCPQTSFRFLTATSAPNAAGAGGGSADMFGMYTAGLSDFGCDHSPHGAGTDFHDGMFGGSSFDDNHLGGLLMPSNTTNNGAHGNGGGSADAGAIPHVGDNLQQLQQQQQQQQQQQHPHQQHQHQDHHACGHSLGGEAEGVDDFLSLLLDEEQGNKGPIEHTLGAMGDHEALEVDHANNSLNSAPPAGVLVPLVGFDSSAGHHHHQHQLHGHGAHHHATTTSYVHPSHHPHHLLLQPHCNSGPPHSLSHHHSPHQHHIHSAHHHMGGGMQMMASDPTPLDHAMALSGIQEHTSQSTAEPATARTAANRNGRPPSSTLVRSRSGPITPNKRSLDKISTLDAGTTGAGRAPATKAAAKSSKAAKATANKVKNEQQQGPSSPAPVEGKSPRYRGWVGDAVLTDGLTSISRQLESSRSLPAPARTSSGGASLHDRMLRTGSNLSDFAAVRRTTAAMLDMTKDLEGVERAPQRAPLSSLPPPPGSKAFVSLAVAGAVEATIKAKNAAKSLGSAGLAPSSLGGLRRAMSLGSTPGAAGSQDAGTNGQTGPRKRRQNTSKYRGVTYHQRTSRWEAHIWDQGRQMYLGGFDTERKAATAYDIMALKCRGAAAVCNFGTEVYQEEMEHVNNMTKEELMLSLRRNSKGFSRGSSKYRGVSHHPNGRWEARIGHTQGRRYRYLGLYDTEVEAALAYDRAAVIHRGSAAVTNFDISNYAEEAEMHALEQAKSKSGAPGDAAVASTGGGKSSAKGGLMGQTQLGKAAKDVTAANRAVLTGPAGKTVSGAGK
mmetsp:Transcript_12705/g.46455  ORF Transcript_12705/g.46455 Transcript_12705/m.46455 type:complete len:877 (+) Transcript_12705:346-2976(+)